MISARVRTEGLEGFARSVIDETKRDARRPLSQGGDILPTRARQKLGSRGGPSRPGDPPARVLGALQDSIGRNSAYIKHGEDVVELAWGVGVGDDAERRVRAWLARGVDVFAYAKLHEEGGRGADGRRYPQRSYLRSTEAEEEGRVFRHVERAFR